MSAHRLIRYPFCGISIAAHQWSGSVETLSVNCRGRSHLTNRRGVSLVVSLPRWFCVCIMTYGYGRCFLHPLTLYTHIFPTVRLLVTDNCSISLLRGLSLLCGLCIRGRNDWCGWRFNR